MIWHNITVLHVGNLMLLQLYWEFCINCLNRKFVGDPNISSDTRNCYIVKRPIRYITLNVLQILFS